MSVKPLHFFVILLTTCSPLAGSVQDLRETTGVQNPPLRDQEFKVRFETPVPVVPAGLRLSCFDIDATPPVGSRLAYDIETNTWDLGLRAKGIVILGAGQPVVLCAVDWLYICNDSHDAFRQALAEAVGTIPERVAVHTVHQHDAPYSDFGAEKIMTESQTDPGCFQGDFARELIRKLAVTVRQSLRMSEPVTHVGFGSAIVESVASNRRILDEKGRVRATRWTTTTDSALRAEPEGVIDPEVALVSFWNNDKPLAVLSYYATHPQSYYRTGIANPDFPGIARFFRQLAVPDALHVHFTGAGGNITAGKYNDGAHLNRLLLAEHLAEGMKRAWESTVRDPVTSSDVKWAFESVLFTLPEHLQKLKSGIAATDTLIDGNLAPKLVWIRRIENGIKSDVTCLSLGRIRILNFPGELFVEYQLFAKLLRKDLLVAVAAYGDCGAGYIGTSVAYEQGGYETGQVSLVGPDAETLLVNAIHKLLVNQ